MTKGVVTAFYFLSKHYINQTECVKNLNAATLVKALALLDIFIKRYNIITWVWRFYPIQLSDNSYYINSRPIMMERAGQRLAVVLPLTFLIVIMLLYLDIAYEGWKKRGALKSFADLRESIHADGEQSGKVNDLKNYKNLKKEEAMAVKAGRIISMIIVFGLLFAALSFAQETAKAKNPIVREGVIDLEAIDENNDGKVFQDQMDWNVISDKPGKCPLCGMTLKEVSLEKAKEELMKNGFKVKQ